MFIKDEVPLNLPLIGKPYIVEVPLHLPLNGNLALLKKPKIAVIVISLT